MNRTTSRYSRPDLDWRAKGLPAMASPVAAQDISGLGWNLFDGRTMLPAMVVKRDALEHDISVMATYAREHDISLAPHGKTTMSPQIWQQQIDAGAWAITVATAWQARVAASVGIARIFIANEVVDDAGIEWLASTLDGSGPELVCQVDSLVGVERLRSRLGPHERRLDVLLEVGMPGGRTGLRTDAQAVDVLDAIVAAPSLRIAGVTCYEGAASGETMEAKRSQVLKLLARVRSIASVVAPRCAAQGATEMILSGGGSIHFPEVVDELTRPLTDSLPTRVVIRSGCTVAHDDGGYDVNSPFGSNAALGEPRLRAALEVWAPVISTPEPGLAFAGAGRRDLPYDLGLPTVLKVRSPGGSVRAGHGIRVTKLDDQHAYLAGDDSGDLSVGDIIGFGISHPCSAFDRWRFIPVVDQEYNVVDVYETVF